MARTQRCVSLSTGFHPRHCRKYKNVPSLSQYPGPATTLHSPKVPCIACDKTACIQGKDVFPALDQAWTAFAAGVTENTATSERIAALTDKSFSRPAPFKQRLEAQAKALGLPVLPTTTIGSFPQANT